MTYLGVLYERDRIVKFQNQLYYLQMNIKATCKKSNKWFSYKFSPCIRSRKNCSVNGMPEKCSIKEDFKHNGCLSISYNIKQYQKSLQVLITNTWIFTTRRPRLKSFLVQVVIYINPSLVLVQPSKTRPFITERVLMVFVWFDSLRPINKLSVKQGRVFLGWTSTKLG